MTKFEFLTELRAKLWSIPHSDAERTVEFYSEMIDDRMEEGLSEEAAVADIGNLDEIVRNILAEAPRTPVVAAPQKKHWQAEPWMIVLLIIGAPVWIPVVAGVLSSAVSIYVSMWTVVIVLYAVAIALSIAAVGCVVACFFMIGSAAEIAVALGAAALCAGFGILLFLLSNLAAKGMVALTKLICDWVKGIFTGKERTV